MDINTIKSFKVNLLGAIILCSLSTLVWANNLVSGDCLDCHGDVSMVGENLVIDVQSFDRTAHADVGCPTCHATISDLHPEDGQPPSKASCADCHDRISAEYNASPHAGKASCNDCHNPHRALGPTAVSGADMNRTCLACHEVLEMKGMHAQWLPQADLHIDMLPCITCHSSSDQYVITLYLAKRQGGLLSSSFELASYAELSTLAGNRPIQELVDSNADGYVSLAELRMFNRDPEKKQLHLLGMMTPEGVSHNFRTQDNRWDCSFCHASGPAARQVSYLSLAQPDGSFRRVAVEKGAVLDALYGTPDFYMVGSTRSTTLNYVGLVILAGGLVLPVGHGAMRFLTRKNRHHEEDES
jgi:predicted CXXCH cytochrome family protein